MTETRTQGGLSYERTISADIEDVWRALTDPDELQQWYHEQVPESSWMPGEPVRFVDPDGTVLIEGSVVDVDAPHRLVHTFAYTPAADATAALDAQSQVTWAFEPDDDGTRILLLHDGLTSNSATWRSVEDSWEQLLDGLAELFGEGREDDE